LQISKDEFERPDGFDMKVDCWSAPRSSSGSHKEADSTGTEEQNIDEFGL
jgi:penicillin-binding protein 1A